MLILLGRFIGLLVNAKTFPVWWAEYFSEFLPGTAESAAPSVAKHGRPGCS